MIINFTLDKISIEKTQDPKGTIEAKNSIKFLEVTETTNLEGIENQTVLKFKFVYRIEYMPKIATTEIVGYIHYLTDKKEKDKILKEWKNDSKIDRAVSSRFVNYIFSKCGIKALSLSQQLGLPPHINLPRIAIRKVEKDKPKAS